MQIAKNRKLSEPPRDTQASSVVDPRFGVISSPDQIATMEVGSSLGAHLPPSKFEWYAKQQHLRRMTPAPPRTRQQPRPRVNRPFPVDFAGKPHLGYIVDPFVVSDGSAFVSTDTEIKVRSGLSAVRGPTKPPPIRSTTGNWSLQPMWYCAFSVTW